MSIKVINLNKLLCLCELSENKLISALRNDLRTERNKMIGRKVGGGHFHYPWWDAAKDHAVGLEDLREATDRLSEVSGRKRLYPLLTQGFLRWFELFRRNTNLTIGWSEEQVHTHYVVPGMELTVKVDNILALKLGEDQHRLVYPYFSEEPALEEKWARVGLWLMGDALSEFELSGMEILDVLRGRSFSGASTFLRGDEEALFAARYERILALWEELRPEYDLK
ncbi:hypothetical protein SH591_08610 [Sphingomonas sp. LY54]|uniref:hypothetical protein n=1 Tax=Sphingomonas sp. LY54 TaxID=3095343 RepID=UPI002D77C759|nr:hypothetical protein [Sphingomonas sp. LY54]WRP27185.1 hypothetical protein SH591_08610 [Sphingomonas sp. LY54]